MHSRRVLTLVGAVAIALALVAGTAGPALAFGPGWGCGGGTGAQAYSGAMMGRWGWGNGVAPTGDPITIRSAEQAVMEYVAAGNWQDELVVEEVMEFENNFYAIVKEKSTGVGAFEVLVDKYSGYVYPEMGSNMMWNTKYGHMRGSGGWMGGMMTGRWGGSSNGWGPGPSNSTSADLPVTAEQALTRANDYLARFSGAQTAEEPVRFYGYYTLHTLDESGEVTGMLSVNGYSGAVWYHNWHGDFVQEIGGEHAG